MARIKYTLLDFLSGGSIQSLSGTQRFLKQEISNGFICNRELAIEKEDFLYECKLRFQGSEHLLKDADKLFDFYLRRKPLMEVGLAA